MNKKLLQLLEGDESKYPMALAAHYPHIVEKLLEYWGTAQMSPYLDELMMSKRPKNRQGFSAEVTAEIWALNSFYETLYPRDKGLGTDVWQADSDIVHTDWKETAFSKGKDNDS